MSHEDSEVPLRIESIDFSGSLLVRGRKRYLLLLIDLHTRYIYIEITSSLESDESLLDLRSIFTKFRRLRKIIYDNGRTFLKVQKLFPDIEWINLPPYVHWLGGSHSYPNSQEVSTLPRIKHILLITLDDILSFVNDRPLTYHGKSDIELPLTPAQLLFGRDIQPPKFPISGTSTPSSISVNKYRERYLSEYMVSLKGIPQVNKQDSQIKVGDYILSREPNLKMTIVPSDSNKSRDRQEATYRFTLLPICYCLNLVF